MSVRLRGGVRGTVGDIIESYAWAFVFGAIVGAAACWWVLR